MTLPADRSGKPEEKSPQLHRPNPGPSRVLHRQSLYRRTEPTDSDTPCRSSGTPPRESRGRGGSPELRRVRSGWAVRCRSDPAAGQARGGSMTQFAWKRQLGILPDTTSRSPTSPLQAETQQTSPRAVPSPCLRLQK
ncbi:unnamed protein product [Pleuronectes platessa]|uniref:Uncharacterized protein n=1 Tax=Pleuronectes platessa TaxID=8262 RepID=A0A9N7TSQ6_PLEPL|nr:unnamed protein product [Pleuronectes platessa]